MKTKLPQTQNTYYGISFERWQAAFRPGIDEFFASQFIFSMDADGTMRIALGNAGPYVTEQGDRAPVFTHAVTLTNDMALELAKSIMSSIQDKTIGPNIKITGIEAKK